MKIIEYYYNIIYYFFYRGYIRYDSQFFSFEKIFYKLQKTSYMKKLYKKKGIDNPREWFDERIKDRLENPERSLATMYGGGIAIASLTFILVGFYHILKIIFFPSFEDSFGYVLAVTGILAYLIDNLLVTQQDQGVKYIKEFNNIKDKKWRLKWAIITVLTFPFSIWFMITSSTDGMIGKFLMNLHHTESANSILYRPNENSKTIDDLIIKR